MHLQLNHLLMLPNGTFSKLSLKDTIIDSLNYNNPLEGFNEKMKKYELFKKIKDIKEEVDLTVEEIVLVKQSLSVQSPLVFGQCLELIEDMINGKTK